MAYKKCDWCGRMYKPMFSADRDAGNAFADAMGLTIGVKAIGGVARLAGHRNFCSRECKLAYEQSKGGGSSAGATAGGAVTKEAIEAQARAAENAAEQAKVEAIKSTVFSDDDATFAKEIYGFIEDYKASVKGHDSIREAYKERLAKEFSVLKMTNPGRYQKYNPAYEEVQLYFKKRLIRNIIIGVLAVAAFLIVCLVL